MTFRNSSLALATFLGSWVAACGGPTTIDFVGDDNTGGEDMGGSGGSSGSGGSADGGTDVGGMGGDGTGGGVIVTAPYCGDGSIDEDSEACDDGDERSGDGCSSACEVEEPFSCSGEPSACTTVGNGTLDAGEECEDGNTDDGDGCSSAGLVEGTCQEPQTIELDDQGFGTSAGIVAADTSSGGGQVPPAACGGLLLGAGNDRVFQVDLPSRTDLTITLDSDFDGIVRLAGGDTNVACNQDYEAFCIDDVGAGEQETFHFQGVGEGTLYILVDGADEGEEGEFTLRVTAGCDLIHAKLHRLTPYYDPASNNNSLISIKNTSDYCTLDLSGVGLVAADDANDATIPLVPVVLPQVALGSGEVFRAAFEPTVAPHAYDLVEEVQFFDSVTAGVYLCDGPCDMVTGLNVLDAVVMQEGLSFFVAQLPGTSFAPGPLASMDIISPHHAFVRVAYDGAAPFFVASDWSPAFLVDADDFTVADFDPYLDDPAFLPPALDPLLFVDDADEGGAFLFPAETVFAGSYNSLYAGFYPSGVTTPTYISFKYKYGPGNSSWACDLAFGSNDGNLGLSAGYSAASSLSYSYPTLSTEATYFSLYGTVSTPMDVWHVAELENIDFVSHTYSLRVDGVQVADSVLFSDTTATFADVVVIRPYEDQVDCDYTDLIVRNGPPGRTWDSPAVP